MTIFGGLTAGITLNSSFPQCGSRKIQFFFFFLATVEEVNYSRTFKKKLRHNGRKILWPFFVCVYRNYCTNLQSFGSSNNGGSPSGISGMCVCGCGDCGVCDSTMCVSSDMCVCGEGCGNSMVCVSSDMCGDRCGGISVVCDGNRLVDGDMVLVNDGGVNNLVDGVDLVGCGYGIGLGDLNGVGFGNMYVNDDFSLNGNGHSNGDLDDVFVNLELRNDLGHLGSDDRVGPDGSLDFGDGNGISGCGSPVDGGCGDGSIGERGSGDKWSGEGHSALRALGGFSNVGVCWGLADLRVLSEVMSSLDSLGSNLDSSVSNNLVMGAGY